LTCLSELESVSSPTSLLYTFFALIYFPITAVLGEPPELSSFFPQCADTDVNNGAVGTARTAGMHARMNALRNRHSNSSVGAYRLNSCRSREANMRANNVSARTRNHLRPQFAMSILTARDGPAAYPFGAEMSVIFRLEHGYRLNLGENWPIL
jgi:hypothetical protein